MTIRERQYLKIVTIKQCSLGDAALTGLRRGGRRQQTAAGRGGMAAEKECRGGDGRLAGCGGRVVCVCVCVCVRASVCVRARVCHCVCLCLYA